MSELRCERCGITRSHADAQIEDLRGSCEYTRPVVVRGEDGGKATEPSDFEADSHTWIEVDA